MKKYFGFVVVAGLIVSLSLTTLAKAEDGNSGSGSTNSGSGDSSSSRDLREERQEDRQTFRASLQIERQNFIAKLKTDRDAFMLEVKARKEEWKNSKADRKAQFCQAAKEAFTNRFEMAISKLETYQARVGDIIVTLNADGKDTADATASLNLSKQKLVDAKAKLVEIKALVPEGGCENMTPEIFEKIKVGARAAKDLLKESRENLHDAIKDTRNLKGETKIIN